MLYLVLGLTFVTVFFLVQGIYYTVYRDKIIVAQRIEEIASMNKKQQIEDELDRPFFERVVRPVLERIALSLGKAIPAKKRISLQRKLLAAGNPLDLSPNEFMVIQYALTLLLPVIGIVVVLPLGWSPAGMVAVVALGGTIGFLLPEYYLKAKSAARQEEIQDTLPDVLDLLTVSVEAGLGFDAAMVKVVEKIKGVLSQECARMLQEVKMGKPRRDALKDLGVRTGVEDVQSFVGAVIQADQLGVSIGNVLRVQSEQMRQKRRQRAEQKAMKAPVKMLIPLIIFIFPTIFIVVLGPAAIQVLKTF